MSDIKFETNLDWSGTGQTGEGKITMGEKILNYSSPSAMGGKGVGVSPEDLLVGAISTCYSGTLFSILVKKRLTVERVSVRAEGIVTGYPSNTKFSRLIVHPTIIGGDSSKQDEYEKAAVSARDHCFIGKSITGNIDYEVGTVQIKHIILQQEKVDELVERFYRHLTKETYFSTMFAERHVDIEKLKERQKVFISRLINNDTSEKSHENVERIQERHPFHTTPEQAKTWLGLMEQSIDEMQFDAAIKESLMKQMNRLMDSMIQK